MSWGEAIAAGIAVFSVCATLIGCTWKLGEKINSLVTHQQCHDRRAECPCVTELTIIKERMQKR